MMMVAVVFIQCGALLHIAVYRIQEFAVLFVFITNQKLVHCTHIRLASATAAFNNGIL